jgi:hypothetical protein
LLARLRSLSRSYWFRVVFEGLLIGGIVAFFSVRATSVVDDRRSVREIAASERLGWRVTLATSDSFQDAEISGTNPVDP